MFLVPYGLQCCHHNGLVIIIVVGLGYPVVTDLDFSLGGDTPFSLFCSSLNSPPTEILWGKDSQKLSLDSGSGRYKTNQMLVNRATSGYVSSLTMVGVLDDVMGEYSCTVVNSIGTSNTLSITIKRMDDIRGRYRSLGWGD